MIKKLKTLILSAGAVLTVAAPLAFVGVASATTTDVSGSLCAGADLQAAATSSTDCSSTDTSSFSSILATIINVLSLVVGTVAVIMIIIAGFNYVTSNGDDGKVGTAKKTIVNAIVGLVIVAFAQVIVKFVLHKAG